MGEFFPEKYSPAGRPHACRGRATAPGHISHHQLRFILPVLELFIIIFSTQRLQKIQQSKEISCHIMARIAHEDNTPSSWVGWKERGKDCFQNGNYERALNAYTQALRPEFRCPVSEQQILWSNIVACRLKMGGRAQAEAAVEAAKQCVALNDAWAKGHVRLASAYIALGDHSNDACNALQRALQLDPGNRTARDMLVRELRRDRTSQTQSANTWTSTATTPSPSAPAEDLDDQDYYPSRRRNDASTPQNTTPVGATLPPRNRSYNDDIDHGGLSWNERMHFYAQRAKHWYNSQNDDVKTVLKVLLGLVVLYVAFGGRFGLEYLSSSSSPSGHRSSSDVYRDFYQERRQLQFHEQQHHGRSNNNNNNNNRDYYDLYAGTGYDSYHSRSSRRSSSWGMVGGGGNNYGTMLMLAGVAYIAHRNGINPFQALFFANMAMGGRGRRPRGFYPGGGGGGWGRGMMGGYGHGGGARPRW
jgi:Tetratricopeptide repeat